MTTDEDRRELTGGGRITGVGPVIGAQSCSRRADSVRRPAYRRPARRSRPRGTCTPSDAKHAAVLTRLSGLEVDGTALVELNRRRVKRGRAPSHEKSRPKTEQLLRRLEAGRRSPSHVRGTQRLRQAAGCGAIATSIEVARRFLTTARPNRTRIHRGWPIGHATPACPPRTPDALRAYRVHRNNTHAPVTPGRRADTDE